MKVLSKIYSIIQTVFGYGIMLCLLLGGVSFFGYVAALCIGGDTAAAICSFIYEKAYPILVISSTSLIAVGLINMYIAEIMNITKIKKEKKR